ncbi:hypothetical protein ACJIZ3_001553 [Penstemon smallii]|uniref:Uncharacterized protein n=1 Tax=Penstemon smallii TaxID=265156 RepID=A0ABD3U6T9_9LAMI
MMLRVWKWYQNCLATHPVKTQVISSGFIWGFGDIAAQTVTKATAKRHHLETHKQGLVKVAYLSSQQLLVHQNMECESLIVVLYFKMLDKDKELKINWRRVATTSLFGLAFVGPVGHFWSVFLFVI